jgi:hypothetical protein
MTIIQATTRQRDAHGAECNDCGTFFNVSTSPYWHWAKSAAMHRLGTGHRITLYRIVAS